ncbi:hypothetical protein ER45_028880 (plasmid) [Bacillus mycoides]|nr:hypothetical protein ER45_028880 [Bacillus mycoides]
MNSDKTVEQPVEKVVTSGNVDISGPVQSPMQLGIQKLKQGQGEKSTDIPGLMIHGHGIGE